MSSPAARQSSPDSLSGSSISTSRLRVSTAVARALAHARPVVALESSVFAQGLPRPANATAADRMLAALRKAGVVAAVTGVLRGTPTVGMTGAELTRFLAGRGIGKVSTRDLAPAAVAGSDGATTVSSAMALAHLAGIAVLATGGIGGVHRGGGHDESADLLELSRVPMIVVCSGAKAFLDLIATAERLESLSVPVVGYRTDTFPAFYTEATEISVSARADSPTEVARIFAAHRALRRPGALLLVQPPPSHATLPRPIVEGALAGALRRAERAGITGPALTPFLLRAVEEATAGRSVEANVALLERNAGLAARVAVACAKPRNNR